MPLYSSKIKIKNTVKKIDIQARNEEEAKATVSRMGKVVTFKKKFNFDLKRGLTPGERQIFFNRLSSMLSSRVGTSEALTLMRDTFSGKIQEVSGRLLTAVEGGDDLSAAIERIGYPDFPEATTALIKAGARTGESGRALKDAAEFEYQLHNIRKNASKGLITGVGSFILAGVVTVISTLYIGPKIMESPLIKMANVDIDWMTTTGYVTGYIIGILLFIGFLFWLLGSVGRQVAPVMADSLILKIPYYKDLVLAKNNFIVLYGLALLIKSGVRTEEALRLSAEGSPRGALKRDLLAAMTAVKSGKSWPNVMATLHPTDKAALMCATDREQIAHTLDTLANQYRELYGQRLASFVPIINMVAALFMAIAGGLLFGESILPMLMASTKMF